MNLTNASAIVTGGASGFGSATVRRLAQMGAKALTVRATRSPTSENAVMAKFAEEPAPPGWWVLRQARKRAHYWPGGRPRPKHGHRPTDPRPAARAEPQERLPVGRRTHPRRRGGGARHARRSQAPRGARLPRPRGGLSVRSSCCGRPSEGATSGRPVEDNGGRAGVGRSRGGGGQSPLRARGRRRRAGGGRRGWPRRGLLGTRRDSPPDGGVRGLLAAGRERSAGSRLEKRAARGLRGHADLLRRIYFPRTPVNKGSERTHVRSSP